jgi:hypothetical protein
MASAVHLDEAMQAVGFGKDFHSQGMGRSGGVVEANRKKI